MKNEENMSRGGRPDSEILHGQHLLQSGAEDIWGWNTPAGHERVNARVRWIVKQCVLRPGVSVMECGCGTGMFTRKLAETGATITAVDISQDLLGDARKKCTASNVKFVTGNLEDPASLPAGDFDVVCGVSVLHHLDLSKALPALRGKLKSGGVFAFSEPNMMNPVNKYLYFTNDPEKRKKYGVSPGEQAFYRSELAGLFREAGFKIRSLEYRDFMHPSIPGFMIPAWRLVQYTAEHLPFLRCWSGSLWIRGDRGGA